MLNLNKWLKAWKYSAYIAFSRYLISGRFALHGYYAERKGEREDMQDAHIILDNFTTMVPGLHSTVYGLNR